MNPELESIRNFVAFDPRIGTAGQPTREQFPLIAAAGYSAVINLAMADHHDSLPDEGAIVANLGMDYIHLPVPFDAPTAAHLHRFCDIMDVFKEDKIFIHCIMNYRVSAFLGLYRITRQGWEKERAFELMQSLWQPNEVWDDFIKTTLSQLK